MTARPSTSAGWNLAFSFGSVHLGWLSTGRAWGFIVLVPPSQSLSPHPYKDWSLSPERLSPDPAPRCPVPFPAQPAPLPRARAAGSSCLQQYVPLFLCKEDLDIAVQSAYAQRNAAQIKLYKDKADKYQADYDQVGAVSEQRHHKHNKHRIVRRQGIPCVTARLGTCSGSRCHNQIAHF